jgi:vitamin B12/bleomycin/antimicrobial peptide transport system ATP-binding/permease protein
MPTPNRHAWSDIVAIGKPFFVSPMRWRAAGALSVIVGLLLTLNALNVANSYVGRSFITAISQRNRERYFVFAAFYLVVFAASTVTGVFAQFVQDRLALSWRDWLTRHLLARYLSGHTFGRISAKREIDNPDQRISEDVRTFTSTLLSFVVMTVNGALTTVAFAGVLWSITPALLLTAILYATLGSLFTILLGRRLVHLDNLQLKKEADLRYGLIHLREHVEPLSERAEGNEGRRILANLRRVVHNSRAIIGVNRNVGLFTSGYNYLVQLLPILIVAPRYLRGEIELGVVTQAAMAFAQLLGAFSLIIVQFQSISAFAAVIRRLGSLWQEMNATSRGAGPLPTSDSIA